MKELKLQLVSALLVIVTVAAVIAAGFNFNQQNRYHLPDDGVIWVDQPSGETIRVVALRVQPGSPGAKAGLHAGDILLSIEGVKIQNSLQPAQVLARLGAWKTAQYTVLHDGHGEEVQHNVIITETERDSTLLYLYADGAVYLAIGLFVYFRRSTAPRALHFFMLCLASFVLATFHYTGKLNDFDKIIYLGNVVAGYFAPLLFLHFCCVFPEPQQWIRHRGAAFLLYLPGLALLVFHIGVVFEFVRTAAPLLEMRWMLDRTWLTFL